MSPKLRQIAERVRTKADIPKEEVFGEILTILMIISIILTVIRVIQECNKPKLLNLKKEEKYGAFGDEIKTYAIKRGWWTRMRAKKIIKKHMTTEQYQKYGPELLEALFDTGENLTTDEIYTLAEAANV